MGWEGKAEAVGDGAGCGGGLGPNVSTVAGGVAGWGLGGAVTDRWTGADGHIWLLPSAPPASDKRPVWQGVLLA